MSDLFLLSLIEQINDEVIERGLDLPQRRFRLVSALRRLYSQA